MNANEVIYGRYGGRDAKGAEDRLSLPGLRYAMKQALDRHRMEADTKAPSREPPFRPEDFPAAKRHRGGCIHCHEVNEFRRQSLQASGKWNRDEVWAYPLPENVGLTLEVDQGDRIKAVTPGSTADKAGVKAGDVLKRLNDRPVASLADAQYALHKAPKTGRIGLEWLHDGETKKAELELADGWRKTNLTWRPSMLDILPGLPMNGDDLTADEKKALGLGEKRVAFRLANIVHSTLRAAGVQPRDIVIGIDGKPMEGEMGDFLAYVRRNYLVGDKVTLNLVRDGKMVNMPFTLK